MLFAPDRAQQMLGFGPVVRAGTMAPGQSGGEVAHARHARAEPRGIEATEGLGQPQGEAQLAGHAGERVGDRARRGDLQVSTLVGRPLIE